jgi:hypothetical protein
MSCYFEDPYLRNYQCFFYPTAWNRLSIAKQIIKCAILEDTTFKNVNFKINQVNPMKNELFDFSITFTNK